MIVSALGGGGAQDGRVDVGAVQPTGGDDTVSGLRHVDAVPAHMRRHILAHGVALVVAPPALIVVVDAAPVPATRS